MRQVAIDKSLSSPLEAELVFDSISRETQSMGYQTVCAGGQLSVPVQGGGLLRQGDQAC